MPTNRPFLANLLSAFRAHNALTKPSTAQSTVATAASTNTPSASFPSTNGRTRPITTAASGTAQKHPSNTTPTTPPSSPPTSATMAGVNHHLRHTSQHTSPSPPSQRQNPFSNPLQYQPRRRGSDSSSDSGGFREVVGGEKWYVGGRTATGEERFLALGVVRKGGVGARRSLDALSL